VLVKDYPKDDEQRLISIERATCQQLREHMMEYAVRDIDLLFTSTAGMASTLKVSLRAAGLSSPRYVPRPVGGSDGRRRS